MESGIQSSFIPKDAAEPTRTVRHSSGGLMELVVLVMIVLFITSAALAVAVFLYKQYLEASASSKRAALERAREAFDPTTILEITRLDDRMRAAEQILGDHIAPTAFFAALQLSTLTTVGFTSLDLLVNDDETISAKMTGIAESVNSIALQADVFSKNGVVVNPIFSDITRQQDGVHFSLATIINPAAVNYVQLIAGLVAAQQSESAPIQQSPEPFGQGTTTEDIEPPTE